MSIFYVSICDVILLTDLCRQSQTTNQIGA
jgi:hypothetical protein